MKSEAPWPSLNKSAGPNDRFVDLRAAYLVRLHSDLAELTALDARLAAGEAPSQRCYQAIQRLSHGMAGAAAIFKAFDIMAAARALAQTVALAESARGDESRADPAVRAALATLIEALQAICA